MNEYEEKMLDVIKGISRSGLTFEDKLKKALELKRQEPNSKWVRLYSSTLQADNSQYMKAGWEKELEDAVESLKLLLDEIDDMPEDFQLRVQNEYFYYSKQYRKQYELGLSHYQKYKNVGAHFSCAVGATMLAYAHFKDSEESQAKEWAKEGLKYSRLYEELKPRGAQNISYFTIKCLLILEGKESALKYLHGNENLSPRCKEEVEDYLTNTTKVL